MQPVKCTRARPGGFVWEDPRALCVPSLSGHSSPPRPQGWCPPAPPASGPHAPPVPFSGAAQEGGAARAVTSCGPGQRSWEGVCRKGEVRASWGLAGGGSGSGLLGKEGGFPLVFRSRLEGTAGAGSAGWRGSPASGPGVPGRGVLADPGGACWAPGWWLVLPFQGAFPGGRPGPPTTHPARTTPSCWMALCGH